MKAYNFSRFLRVIKDDAFIAVFHQLHPEPVYFRKDLWEDMVYGSKEFPKSTRDELIWQKLLIEDDADDCRELETYRLSINSSLDRPTILYLMLAQGCNNACTYCPIPVMSLLRGYKLLSFEDAVSGIELWQRHLAGWSDDGPYYVLFYGGEPLLNRTVFEQLVCNVAQRRMSGELPVNVELILPTNGLLLDDALAKMLAQHNILTVIGIDGAPLYNDTTRRTREGEPTSLTLERKVEMLHRYGVRIAASTTLTPANVHAAGEHKEYLSSLGITNIGFNVLKGNALKMSLGFMAEAEYYHAAAEAVVGYGDNDGVMEYQLQKRVDALAERKPFSVDCTCYGNQLVIQADGMVTNCPFLRIDLGHVRSLSHDFRIGKSEAVRLWRRRIPLLVEENGLEYQSFLHGGGCAWGSNEQHDGVLSKLDAGNELFNSEVMYAIVWKMLSEQARGQLLRGESIHWSYRGVGSL